MRPEAEWTICPDVNFADFADGAGLNVFDGETCFVRRMALIAHLRGDLGFLGLLGKSARFRDRPGEGLLHVNVLAKFHRGQRDRCVHVVGGGDDDGVNVFLLFEHLPIVFVALGLLPVFGVETLHVGKLLFRRGRVEAAARLRLRLTARGRLIDARLKTFDVRAEAFEGLAGIIPVEVAERSDVLAGECD